MYTTVKTLLVIVAISPRLNNKENRNKYERDYVDETTGITVTPIFIETGK